MTEEMSECGVIHRLNGLLLHIIHQMLIVSYKSLFVSMSIMAEAFLTAQPMNQDNLEDEYEH